MKSLLVIGILFGDFEFGEDWNCESNLETEEQLDAEVDHGHSSQLKFTSVRFFIFDKHNSNGTKLSQRKKRKQVILRMKSIQKF